MFVASMNVHVSLVAGAGRFLLTPGRGDVYSIDDAASWFDQTAWRMVEHKALAGPASLIVAEAEQRSDVATDAPHEIGALARPEHAKPLLRRA